MGGGRAMPIHLPGILFARGEIKEVEEVWKKWKGKEASMFMALASKYKDPFHAKVFFLS